MTVVCCEMRGDGKQLAKASKDEGSRMPSVCQVSSSSSSSCFYSLASAKVVVPSQCLRSTAAKEKRVKESQDIKKKVNTEAVNSCNDRCHSDPGAF